ncbi:MAG: hypothetical protein Q4G05_02610 [Clostridia bacterium]|nr:hypothetical protein [Clostridia bacterium]
MFYNRKKIIKRYISIFAVLMILIYSIIEVVKYNVEGEKNMPFNLSKITIVSTAEGKTKENGLNEKEKQWCVDVIQNNDIYFSIQKNDRYKKEEKIQSISIENIVVEEEPKKGEIKKYMPNSIEGNLFNYDEAFLVGYGLTYKGAEKSDYKLLQIGNQGGTALIRISNTELGEYVLDKESELVHDGNLLANINLKNEEVKFKVKFDLIIDVKNKAFKTTIELELPYGDITKEGTETQELINDGKFIFKRV